MPPDPFADDPDDPARVLRDVLDDEDVDVTGGLADEEDPSQHGLDEQDREDLRADIADLDVYQSLLEPRGYRGVVVDCGDCEEPHYHDWELLRASLRQLLEANEIRPHEPAYEPAADSYVTWEYCRGYADGVRAAENARR